MHQAILPRGLQERRGDRGTRCGSLRSSSSSMPPQVIRSSSRCSAPADRGPTDDRGHPPDGSNPLPPAVRASPAPSGPAAEVAIREDGTLLAAAIGEIVIRGRNVTAGYENNPKANAEAFVNGWFRTGDQGVMDADGYVSDDRAAEGDHQPRRREDQPARGRRDPDGPPAVAQVVCFGMPHPKLGEEVAAVVVLREGCRPPSVNSGALWRSAPPTSRCPRSCCS